MCEKLVELAPHLLWVGTLVFVVLRFPRLFQEFVAGIKRLSITSEGIELERAVEAAREVILAKERRSLSAGMRDALARLPAGKRLLWVDDHPENNDLEAAAFEAAGITVIRVRSNQEAAEAFAGVGFDLTISDINRDSDESGIELPRAICRDRNRVPPIVYYTGTVQAERTPEGYPVTAEPSTLFRWVGDILKLRS